MLTDEDIQKLIKEFQIVFATKGELQSFKEEMAEKFDNLQTSVDEYLKEVKKNSQEITVMGKSVRKNTDNIASLAESTGTELEK